MAGVKRRTNFTYSKDRCTDYMRNNGDLKAMGRILTAGENTHSTGRQKRIDTGIRT